MLAPLDFRAMGLVALGAAAGGTLRYALSTLIAHHAGHGFPWGTLAVNLSGCLLIGAAMPFLLTDEPGAGDRKSVALAFLLVTGVLGGYTTLSAFAFETLRLLRQEQWLAAIAYVLVTNLGAIALAAIGFFSTRAWAK